MGVLNCEFIRVPLGGSVEAPSRELLVSGSAPVPLPSLPMRLQRGVTIAGIEPSAARALARACSVDRTRTEYIAGT